MPQQSEEEATETRAGLVALVGFPNVGKSSLMNRLVEQKLSIVTPLAQTTRERVLGIDTPEMQGRCPAERAAAIASRQRLAQLVGRTVQLINVRPDKYAERIGAEVRSAGGADIAAIMIGEGRARPYFGGKREGWCS